MTKANPSAPGQAGGVVFNPPIGPSFERTTGIEAGPTWPGRPGSQLCSITTLRKDNPHRIWSPSRETTSGRNRTGLEGGTIQGGSQTNPDTQGRTQDTRWCRLDVCRQGGWGVQHTSKAGDSRVQWARPTRSCTCRMVMKDPSKKRASVGGGRPVHWSKAEDEALRKLVAEHGTKKWTLISSLLKTKHSKQCRRRWKNGLSEEMKSCEWTPEEDRILMDMQKKVGNRWTEIAKSLVGRTDNAVKNRFFALSKRNQRTTSMIAKSSESSTSRFSSSFCIEEEEEEEGAQVVDTQPLVTEIIGSDLIGFEGCEKEYHDDVGIPLDSVFLRTQPTTHLMDALDLIHELPGDLLSYW